MIEQIKENLEFSELWWNSATEGDPIAQDEIDLAKEMNAHVRYLIGEVERLKRWTETLQDAHTIELLKLRAEVSELKNELSEWREEEEPGPRFRMDAQGNLTLVEEE